MSRFYMNTLEPPEDIDAVTERYEASDEFTTDALEWAFDNPTPAIIEEAREEYRGSSKYATAIDDIATGERDVA